MIQMNLFTKQKQSQELMNELTVIREEMRGEG